MATKYTNLPGVFLDVLDGQLTTVPSPGDPIFLILGTSDTTQENINGVDTDITWPYTVDSTSDATQLFGSTSGLGKGMIEAAAGGATNFRLWNIGPNVSKGRALYEGLFKAYDAMYDQPVDFAIPYGVYLDDENIMDMTAAEAQAAITAINNGTDTNTLGRVCARKVNAEWQFAWWFPEDPANLGGSGFDTTNLIDGSLTITDEVISSAAAYSGSILSFTLANAFLDDGTHAIGDFGNLDSPSINFARNAELADFNAVGDYHISGTTVSFHVGAGLASTQDAFNLIALNNAGNLTLTYKTTITGITANIVDTGGVLADIGAGVSRDFFHEVNFAYQLADFCHRGSSIVDMRLGFIGVNPPAASAFDDLVAQSNWVGTSPVAANATVSADGTGLLGNKFMAGSATYRSAIEGGGFMATTEISDAARGFLSGTEVTDANGAKVDIGKYLSIVASWATVGTGTGWVASAAAVYAGFASTLAPQSAPTNKSLQGMMTLKGSVAAPSLDLLAGAKYVGLLNKATRSAVIADSPTSALSSSDYRRLSTMRQVEECVDGIRLVSEPFLGEGMTAAELAALDTAIGSKLKDIQSRGIISGYDYQVLMSPEQKVLGEATVQLKLIPAFELRQITIVVGLSAS